MKHLGKIRRMKLFKMQLDSLKRIVGTGEPESVGVFRDKTPFDKRDEVTVRILREAYRIFSQTDIYHLKTTLYHLDPCDNKSNYKRDAAPIAEWCDIDKYLTSI